MKRLKVVLFLAVLSLCSTGMAQDPDLTGSWYVPEQTGWGLSIDHAPEAIVIYWYDYGDPVIADGFEDQLWLVGSAAADLSEPVQMIRPDGLGFQLGYVEPGDPIASIEIVDAESTPNQLLISYRIYDSGVCQPVVPGPIYPLCRGDIELTRLTRRQ